MSGWTILWIVLLSIFGLLLLLLIVPVYLRVTFQGELTVKIRIMGMPIKLYPKKKKKDKPPKAGKPPKNKKQKPDKQRKESFSVSQMLKEDGVGAVVSYYTSLAGMLKTGAKRLLRTVTVDHLDVRLTVASADAAETAQNYGRVCAAALWVLIGSGILLWLFGLFFAKRTITRIEGSIMVLCYIA